jgi:phosphoglycolate phosphatase-like HAD superfamily hydrolase
MRVKTALITDLDNTLFDWVDLWYKCFSAMFDEIVRISELPRDTLIPEIRAIHQKYGTSEYSFLIEELPSLKPILKGRPATEVFAPAIEAYRTQRRANLKLFPTVAETLLKIKGRERELLGTPNLWGSIQTTEFGASDWTAFSTMCSAPKITFYPRA